MSEYEIICNPNDKDSINIIEIDRVLETPKSQIISRGKTYEMYEPLVGSLVLNSRSGYSDCGHISHVVIDLTKHKRGPNKGKVNKVLLAQVHSLNSNKIKYIDSNFFELSRYFKGGEERWGASVDDELTNYYMFDTYKPYFGGYGAR